MISGDGLVLDGLHRFGPGLLAAGLLGRLELVVEAALEPVVDAVSGGGDELGLLRRRPSRTNSRCRSMISWIVPWPNRIASNMSFSASRGRSPRSSRPSRRCRRRSGRGRCLPARRASGRRRTCPSMRPTRTRGDRPAERQRRDEQGRGDAVHGEHVGVVLLVAGQHDRLALHFVADSPWETAAGSAGRRAAR